MNSPDSSLLVGIVFGGLISWLITHRYHIISSREQRQIYSKLPDDIREVILKNLNPSDRITREELMQLLGKMSTEPIDTHRLRGPVDGGQF